MIIWSILCLLIDRGLLFLRMPLVLNLHDFSLPNLKSRKPLRRETNQGSNKKNPRELYELQKDIGCVDRIVIVCYTCTNCQANTPSVKMSQSAN